MNQIRKRLKFAIARLEKAPGISISPLRRVLDLLPTHAAYYHHANGGDIYLFQWRGKGFPTEHQLIDALNLDFDADSEWIVINTLSPVIRLQSSPKRRAKRK